MKLIPFKLRLQQPQSTHRNSSGSTNLIKNRVSRVVAVAGLSTLLSACQNGLPSSTDVLNMVTPKSGFTLYQDIKYGSDPRQRLDIYVPTAENLAELKASGKELPGPSQPLPTVFFVHGGSWEMGNKSDYLFIGQSLTDAGYIAVLINYRLAPEHPFPDYVNDTAQALKFTRENIQDYGGSADKILALGHSAGAFNIVSALDDPQFTQRFDLPDQPVMSVVGIAGPYGYDYRKFESRTAFPPNSDPKDIMPVYNTRANPVPHLLLTAEKDTLVGKNNTTEMAQSLREQGGEVEVGVIKGASHTTVIAAMANRLKFIADTRTVVLDYLRRQLEKDQSLSP